jgi:hypothetical protein
LLYCPAVPLCFEYPCRVGTFTYSAAGRKLHVRILNGNLLVRTGGGYQDLLDALGKLPAPSSSTPASPSPAAALTAANSMLTAAASISSPSTPVLAVGAGAVGFNGNSLSDDQDGLLAQQRSGSKCDSTGKQLQHGPSHVPAAASAALAGAHARLDLTGLHSSLYTRASSHSGPLGSARTVDAGSDAVGRSSGSAAAFEAAVQAAVAAAVEAAANAGLDDGMGTSGGGAAPPPAAAVGACSSAAARQASRAALLGRVIAAKTAAGTLIEAGMCPPVPVQEEVGSPPAAAPAVSLADTLTEGDSQE